MSRIGDRQLKVLAKCDAALAARKLELNAVPEPAARHSERWFEQSNEAIAQSYKVKTILLNESDRNLAAQALQLAASKYTEIANSFSDVPSLKSQFERQAADAARIGQLIWDAETVGLSIPEEVQS